MLMLPRLSPVFSMVIINVTVDFNAEAVLVGVVKEMGEGLCR
jgi:hypothetical protein